MIALALLQATLAINNKHRRTHLQVGSSGNSDPSAFLLQGVPQLSFDQSFINVVTFNPKRISTFAVLKASAAKAIMVADSWEKGRVLAYGASLFNNNPFYNSQSSVLKLIVNSFNWLAKRDCAYKSSQPCKVLFVNTNPNYYDGTIFVASNTGITMNPTIVTTISGLDLTQYQILVVDTFAQNSTQVVSKIQTFIRNGGGVLFAFQSKYLDQWNMVQNKVLAPLGIKISRETFKIQKVINQGKTAFNFKLPYTAKATSPPSYLKLSQLQTQLTQPTNILTFNGNYSTVTIPPSNFVQIISNKVKTDRFGGAGFFGQGRIAVLGSSAFTTKAVTTATIETRTFFKNIMDWLVKSNASPRVAQLFGTDCSAFNLLPSITYFNVTDPSMLKVENFEAACLGDFADTPAKLNQFKEAIRSFVENGGGLYAAANSIGWSEKYPTQEFSTTFPFNVILREFGVQLLKGYISRYFIQTTKANTDAPKVKAFLQDVVLPVLNGTLTNYYSTANIPSYKIVIQSLNPYQFEKVCGWQLYNSLIDAFAASRLNSENGQAPQCNSQPFMSTWDLLYQLSVLAPPEVARALPPAINGYPGVASTQVVTKTFQVPLDRNSFFFTGMYANPGESFEVKFAEGLWQDNPFDNIKLALNVNDNIRGLDFPCDRSPILKRVYNLQNQIFSHFGGGAIAFVIKQKAAGKSVKITVTARQGNYFNENLHKLEEAPALTQKESPSLIIQCDSSIYLGRGRSFYNNLKLDVGLTCTYINTVMQYFQLFGYDTRPFQKQMFHADVRIQVGFMHAGNPIQLLEGSFASVLNIGNLSWTKGNWALYHQLGHNHQDRKWTEAATSQVTNNIYSEYFGYKLTGQSIFNRVPELGPGKFNYQVTLKKNVFLFLGWFVVMMDQFGIDFFQKVQKLYNQKGVQVKDNYAKYDQLCIMYSDLTGLNVYSYFNISKMPVTSKCDEYARGLGRPQWHSTKYPYLTDYDYKAL